MATTKDYVHLNFLVFIWGFTAIIGKILEFPVETVLYRTFLAFIGLIIILTVRKSKLNIDRKGFFPSYHLSSRNIGVILTQNSHYLS